MNERNLLIAVVAFAAGVCAMDVAQEYRGCPTPARQVRYITVPQADPVLSPALPVPAIPLPKGTPASLACAHYSATGRGWRCA